MPVYNAEGTLARAVDSILKQSYSDFELILVNDGCTDASGTICDDYCKIDSRIKVIHQSNGGASAARNAALNAVTTKYVTFCDADDYMGTNRLMSLVTGMEDVDVVVAGITYLFPQRKGFLEFENQLANAAQSADIMSARESFGYLPCKCFKTAIIREHKLSFDERFRFLEDEEFICRYWKYVKNVRFVRSTEYYYDVPNFRKKYFDIDSHDLYISLLRNASEFIPNDQDSVTLRKYTMGCFRSMMYAYQHHNYLAAWYRLREFALYGKDYKRHNKYMRIITRWNYILWHPFLIIYTLLKK